MGLLFEVPGLWEGLLLLLLPSSRLPRFLIISGRHQGHFQAMIYLYHTFLGFEKKGTFDMCVC